MAKAKEFNLGKPAPVIDEEDEKTLAAIDEGIRDAGRTAPIEKVRNMSELKLRPLDNTSGPLNLGHCGSGDGFCNVVWFWA